MIPVTYYDRATRTWWGYWQDDDGNQAGDAVHAHNKQAMLDQLKAAP